MADDIDFKSAMKGVRRLKTSGAHHPAPAHVSLKRDLKKDIQNRALQSATLSDSTEIQTVSPDTGESSAVTDSTLFYLSHGIQKKILRDLKKGMRYSYDHVLDLHGLTREKARRSIHKIVSDIQGETSCILIIHGKGHRSPDGATLKIFTAEYLKTLAPVKAYCSAQIQDGGTGALYVLIK